MTTTIKKIRNYALLGTIISASATAPAQASSLDLIQETPLEASQTSDTTSEIEASEKPASCISSPELEPCNELAILGEANNIIKSVEATQTTKVKFFKGHKYTIYNVEPNQSDSEELGTTIYARSSIQKEKVPEPSALLGLIALFLLAKKRQTAPNSQLSTE